MDTDPYAHILPETLCLETGGFLFVCFKGVSESPDSAKALARFKVKDVSVKKRNIGPRHEFILITVEDKQDGIDRIFILDRTVGPENVASDDIEEGFVRKFLEHDLRREIFPALLRTLTPSTIVGAGVAFGSAALISPALAAATVPLSLGATLHSSSDPLTKSPTIFDLPTLRITDAFAFLSNLSVSEASSKSLNTPNKRASANDRWLGSANAETVEFGAAQGARTFDAHNLNLFHLALLADIVHTEYPIYSLFKRNCYWFSGIVYLAAREIDKIFSSRTDFPRDTDDVGNEKDLFYVPFNLYMPDLAGRWLGFKVLEVEKVLVKHIVKLFFQAYSPYEMNVGVFTLFRN